MPNKYICHQLNIDNTKLRFYDPVNKSIRYQISLTKSKKKKHK